MSFTNIIKTQVLHQMNHLTTNTIHQKVETKVLERLNASMIGRLSTSLIIVGAQERNLFIDKILSSHEKLKHASVARISGLRCQNDGHAMLQLSDIFLLKMGISKNSNQILEDMEYFLCQRKIEGSPAIIIIDDIEEFTKKNKQVLLYTLLDFMHNENMFFILIGLTESSHLHTLLEKRVLSRLNAQFMHLLEPTTHSICRLLSQHMRITYGDLNVSNDEKKDDYLSHTFDNVNCNNISDNNTNSTNNNSSSVKKKLKNKASSMAAIKCIELTQDSFDLIPCKLAADEFNESIARVFGNYSGSNNSCSNSNNGNGNSNNNNNRNNNNYNNNNNNSSHSNDHTDDGCCLAVGSIYPLMDCCVSWGYNTEWFIRLAIMAVLNMPDDSSPVITTMMMEEIMAQQQSPSLTEIIAGLSFLELHLLVAVTRVHCTPHRKQKVQEVIEDCDKLTGLLRRKEVSMDMIYLSLIHLSEIGLIWLTNGNSSMSDRYLTCQQISPNTIVYSIPTPQEIQNIFKLKPQNQQHHHHLVVPTNNGQSSSNNGNSSNNGQDIDNSIAIIHPDVILLRNNLPLIHNSHDNNSNKSINSSSSSSGSSKNNNNGKSNNTTTIVTTTNNNNNNNNTNNDANTRKRKYRPTTAGSCFFIRQQPHIRVSERVRRSVLEPMTPLIVTSLTSSQLSLSSSSSLTSSQ